MNMPAFIVHFMNMFAVRIMIKVFFKSLKHNGVNMFIILCQATFYIIHWMKFRILFCNGYKHSLP